MTSGLADSKRTLVCVDASIFVHLLSGTSPAVDAVWDGWEDEHEAIVAPGIFLAEVANALYQIHRAGNLRFEDVQAGVTMGAGLVRLHTDPHLTVRAVELAKELGLKATYDAHYLALVERLGIPFYTADRQLASAARSLGSVHLLPVGRP